jgi:hypothetical protein
LEVGLQVLTPQALEFSPTLDVGQTPLSNIKLGLGAVYPGQGSQQRRQVALAALNGQAGRLQQTKAKNPLAPALFSAEALEVWVKVVAQTG